jgi:hypothetical protein
VRAAISFRRASKRNRDFIAFEQISQAIPGSERRVEETSSSLFASTPNQKVRENSKTVEEEESASQALHFKKN